MVYDRFMKSFDRSFRPDQARQVDMFDDMDDEAAT